MKKTDKINNVTIDRREVEEAVGIVNAFIHGEYKSIYLMDSWAKIMEALQVTA